MTINMKEVYPNYCTKKDCYNIAQYEFTDYKDGKTITLGYTCKDHLIENQEMFKKNNKSKKERGKNGRR